MRVADEQDDEERQLHKRADKEKQDIWRKMMKFLYALDECCSCCFDERLIDCYVVSNRHEIEQKK